jgi:hypothetical protein
LSREKLGVGGEAGSPAEETVASLDLRDPIGSSHHARPTGSVLYAAFAG